MLDPVTALGLTADIVGIVQFTASLVGEVRSLRKNESGYASGIRQTIANSFRQVSETVNTILDKDGGSGLDQQEAKARYR